jgi:putative modified peptide
VNDSQQVSVNHLSTPAQGFELLSRLSQDDEFRAEVEADPATVLRLYGIDLTGAVPPGARLATKEQIRELLDEMGNEEGNPFGSVSDAAWRFQILGMVFRFAALPFVERAPARHGAP